MGKRIVFIHGRNFKPERKVLWGQWRKAVRFGIKRSFPEKLAAYDAAKKTFAYYGDVSNQNLLKKGLEYDIEADAQDRNTTITNLMTYAGDQFTRAVYNKVPGKSMLKELLTDIGSGPMRWVGLDEKVIVGLAPDIQDYWDFDCEFANEVRQRLVKVLKPALASGDDLMVVSHSMGSILAWDVLWQFSYLQEYEKIHDKLVDLWLTLGSPIADETFKKHLRGAGEKGLRKFPANIRKWINVAAIDDHVCHDGRVGNDFKKMLNNNELALQSIEDKAIYNPALRRGSSNPHSSTGYLMHPVVSEIIAGWL